MPCPLAQAALPALSREAQVRLPRGPMSLAVPPPAPMNDEDLHRALNRLDAALMAHERSRRLSIPLRVWRGIRDHFVARAPEWWATALILQFGQILYCTPSAFDVAPNQSVMASIAPEETWGLYCIGVGAVHLVALTVNGTFPRFRWSPHIRAAASLLACVLWLQISWAIFLSGIGGTGFGTYRLVFLLEIFNFIRACKDTGIVDGRRASHAR